jgi:hypothetical protein
MTRRKAPIVRLAVAALLAFAFAGCASAPEGEDQTLESSLGQLYRTGGSADLASLTPDYQWDAVYVFYGPNKGDVIDRTVGGDVVDAGYQLRDTQTLLVFDLRATPVRRALVSQLFFAIGMEKWNTTVRVYSTSCGLVLANPGGFDDSKSC